LSALTRTHSESIRNFIVHEGSDGSSISPFSHEASWKSGRFTKANVKELFTQFAKTIGSAFDVNNIASDIFELTLGHKGLVGVCGSFIETTYNIGKKPISSLNDWKKHTVVNLQHYIRERNTYSSIIRYLRALTDKQQHILSNVLRFGVYQVDPVS